ncbi:sensor domain-containing diguanylate cyclase [Acuticoccus yangtzensis]|uniref:sensor domain-containing diguanylate cyclase n=1 Tax=Acuticoccus yangtzensis TaxID=1443441 RepID=UPI0009496A34|nr:sensor domain-containing diguanylate cyclase [Acuticoccus yangtzensis]
MRDSKLNDEAGRLACLSRLAVVNSKEETNFRHITQVVRTALDLPMAAVSLIDADTQWFKAPEGMDVASTRRADSFCTTTIQRREPTVVNDARLEPPFTNNVYVLGEPHIRAYVGVPLVTMEGYQVGTLCGMDVRPRDFSTAELRLLGELARCVENELELKMTAMLDGLTRLLSRTAFIDLAASLQTKTDSGAPVSLAILDLDHFKSVNDTFGHVAGDDVLKTAARLFGETFGPSAHAGRLGGEEFALLFPGRTVDEAATAIDRYRDALGAAVFAEAPGLRVTASAGVAQLPPAGDDPAAPGAVITETLKCADVALYQAKQAGRDCVIIAGRTPAERGSAPPEEALALPRVRPIRSRPGEIDASQEAGEILSRLSSRDTSSAIKARLRDFRLLNKRTDLFA